MTRKEPTVIPNYLIARYISQNHSQPKQNDFERRRRFRVYAAMVLVAGLGTALIMFLTRLTP